MRMEIWLLLLLKTVETFAFNLEDHIRHGINTLLTVGCTGVGVMPQTTNRYKANISSVFEFGKEKYHIKVNPCRQIKSKPGGKGRQRYLTMRQ